MNHVHEQMAALVAGELDAPARAAVSAHLAGCPDCAGRVADAQRLWDMLAADELPDLGPSRGVWPAVRARTVGTGERGFPGRQSFWPGLGVAGLALTAGLALAVLLPAAELESASLAPAAAYPGGDFWLDDVAGASLNDAWLAVAAQGSDS